MSRALADAKEGVLPSFPRPVLVKRSSRDGWSGVESPGELSAERGSREIDEMKEDTLAGGVGTRLSEELAVEPQPMVEIGGKPLYGHILRICAAHGFKEFVIALG